MFYAGLLFDLRTLKNIGKERALFQLGKLSSVNFILVPFLAWLLVTFLPVDDGLSLAIMTIAIFPCAPVVPSIVGRIERDSSWAVVILITFTILSLPATLIAFWTLTDTSNGWLTGTTLWNLGRYVLLVYPPIAIGIGLRSTLRSENRRFLHLARLAMNASLLMVIVVFSVEHYEELRQIHLLDILYILLFVCVSITCSILLFKDQEGHFASSLLSTGMRNIALAISFSVLVLRRSDISVFHFVYILLAAAGCFAVIEFRTRLHNRQQKVLSIKASQHRHH